MTRLPMSRIDNARTPFVITTASLASSATENGSFEWDPYTLAYRLLNIEVDRACRVRLYKTAAKRTADTARAVGTDIDLTTDHGLIFEYVSTGAISAMLSPTVDGWIPTGTDVFYAIENRSGSTSTVEVIFTFSRTE